MVLIRIITHLASKKTVRDGNMFEPEVILNPVPGIATVIRTDDKLKVLASNNFREQILATPAVIENKIYMRTVDHLPWRSRKYIG